MLSDLGSFIHLYQHCHSNSVIALQKKNLLNHYSTKWILCLCQGVLGGYYQTVGGGEAITK